LAPQPPWRWAAIAGPGYVFTLQAAARFHAAFPALWTDAGLPEPSGLLIGADQNATIQ